MSDFTPGEGWREMNAEERYEGPRRDQLMWTGTAVGDVRYFVREEPMPPLPTDPYTVIRVTWRTGEEPNKFTDGSSVVMLEPAGWALNAIRIPPAELAQRIAGWAPLAEPRAVTAKAVLDQVWDDLKLDEPMVYSVISHQFGLIL